MTRFFFFLIPVFLLACSKEQNKPSANETFQKLQSHMWKVDSTIFLDNNGKREVSIPPTMAGQYIKFMSNQLEYYNSINLDPPTYLDYDAVIYKKPNKLEVWHPWRTGGPPDYKIEVDSVSDTHLHYSFFTSPDYVKEREYYYHAY